MTKLTTEDFISEAPLLKLEKEQAFVYAQNFSGIPRFDFFNPDKSKLRNLSYDKLRGRGWSIFSFKLQSFRHKSYEIQRTGTVFDVSDGAYERETQPEDTELNELVDPEDSQHRFVYFWKVENKQRRLLSYPVEMYLNSS